MNIETHWLQAKYYFNKNQDNVFLFLPVYFSHYRSLLSLLNYKLKVTKTISFTNP